MTGLSGDERDAIAHWAHFGQSGAPVTERFVPDDAERARLADFVRPASASWPDRFDIAQTQLLLSGFPRRDMEDKWIVYSDDIDSDGHTTVHFHRSWTGIQVMSIDLVVDDAGSTCVGATWESDPDTLREPTEHLARSMFVEVCRWVLGMKPAD